MHAHHRSLSPRAMIPLMASLLGPATMAPASFVTFVGTDIAAGQNDARPLSTAAAASFDSAAATLGSSNIITFESAPVGAFSSLTIAPGVTLTGSDGNNSNQTIRNTPASPFTSFFGYNTTAGGANILYLFGGSATFTFAQGILSFGAYFSGVHLPGETIQFSDGASQTITLPNPGDVGGISFVGFIDSTSSIRSITLNTFNPSNVGGDLISVDDVRFSMTSVPEPGSLVLRGIAAPAGLGSTWARPKLLA